MSLCDHCSQPGQPYTYRGKKFDGLTAFQGQRLCPTCRDRLQQAIAADVEAATPVHIGPPK